ncbi:MAG: HAD-IC family P-type ATPase, partial [Candidatus Acidiferrales bacterium]
MTSEEARERLAQFGPNDPAPVARGAMLHELLVLFFNPLTIILLIAAAISGVLGQSTDAGIIFVIVILSVAIDFTQTYRSQRTIRHLREHVSASATALRDSAWQEVKRSEVVPGEIVRLTAGDMVPADGQLMRARDLYVQQAALTGESMPTEKEASTEEVDPKGGPEAPSLVFLGTSVVSGIGIARIRATGPRTMFGAIAKRLVVRPEETEFERGLRRFGMLILRAVVALVFFILATRIALHKDAFESFVFAVALAVGLTPEFLPMITSVTLARGAVRMARAQVIVKHLPAIQNFGTIDVLCSDKTGTLTRGVMTLASSVDAVGKASSRPLSLACLNSKFETGIRSPLDVAILQTDSTQVDGYRKCDEIPFDFNRRRLSIIVERDAPNGPEKLLITKGAPEGIIELCESFDGKEPPGAAGTASADAARAVYKELSGQGYRVLAVASRIVESRDGFSLADEHSLELAGFLAFADPPTEDAA